MKELKARLKIVHELLTHARLIRSKAEPMEAAEANQWEINLGARAEELQKQIAATKSEKVKTQPQPELIVHVE